VQVRIFFLNPVMLMRVSSGRSKLMRVGLHTGTRRLRVKMEVILFLGKENVLIMREIDSANFESSFEACFGFKHLCIYNTFN
jgi:hypothetical protein